MKSTATLKDIRRADKIKSKKALLSTSSNNLKLGNFFEVWKGGTNLIDFVINLGIIYECETQILKV